MDCLKVGLVGIGGFGQVLLQYIARLQLENRLELAAVCDIQLEKYLPSLSRWSFAGLRTYADYERFLSAEQQLDAIVIATPIPLHVEMGIRAMEAGYNVMLEKPPALTIQDIDRMIEVHSQTGKVMAVGFQHTSETSFRRFCEELGQGRIGRIEAVSASGLWQRTHGYFTRSPWVGKLKVDGRYVLDGTIFNPFSHLLMNSLILAGLGCEAEVLPVWVQAELYRANEIEGEDTSCLRALMENGVELFFCSSICARENAVPQIRVRGEEGSAYWDYDGWIRYGAAPEEWREEFRIECDRRYDHLVNFTEYLKGTTSRLSCSLEAARKFVLTANLAFESAGTIQKIDVPFLEKHNAQGHPIAALHGADDFLCIKNIDAILCQAVKTGKLFSEQGIEWAAGRAPVFAGGYKAFKLYE
jgi:predicted dehydrogenase